MFLVALVITYNALKAKETINVKYYCTINHVTHSSASSYRSALQNEVFDRLDLQKWIQIERQYLNCFYSEAFICKEQTNLR